MRGLLFPTVVREAILERMRGSGADIELVDDPVPPPAALEDAAMLILPAHAYSAALADGIRTHGRALRLIQLVSAGYEELSQWGVPPGVAVANVGASWAPNVAEHALAMMLALARSIPALVASRAERQHDLRIVRAMRSVEGATLLVLGYGHIGKEVAKRALSFGMHVRAVTRTAPRHVEGPVRIEPASMLTELAGDADFVVVCVPSSPSTVGLLDQRFFSACKPGCVIVNVARGNVVDTDALEQALASGHLGGAALDVIDPDPLPASHPLWGMENLILSPHAAIAGGQAAMARVAEIAHENLHRLLRGEAPQHLVKP